MLDLHLSDDIDLDYCTLVILPPGIAHEDVAQYARFHLNRIMTARVVLTSQIPGVDLAPDASWEAVILEGALIDDILDFCEAEDLEYFFWVETNLLTLEKVTPDGVEHVDLGEGLIRKIIAI